MNNKLPVKPMGLILAVIALLTIVVWQFLPDAEARQTGANNEVQTQKVEQGTVARTIESPALAAPHRVRTFRSPFGAEIESIAEIGQQVEQGAILVQLNADDAARRLNLAEISLQEAELNLEQSQSQLEQADRALRDREALYASGAVPRDQVQTAREQLESATYRVRSAELSMRKARADLESAHADLDSSRMRAPFTGTVLAAEVSEGDWAGQNTTLMSFGDLSSLRFTAEVDEFDIAQLQIGQQVQIRSDVPDSPVLRARLETISPQAEIVNNIAVFRISAVADNTHVLMRPGMTVDMVVVLERDSGIVIPSSAVETVRARSYVDVYQDGEIETRRVEVGASDGRNSVVTEGLDAGELIVLSDVPGDLSELLFAEPAPAPASNSIVPMPSGGGAGGGGGGGR